jgi:hypothetical protein
MTSTMSYSVMPPIVSSHLILTPTIGKSILPKPIVVKPIVVTAKGGSVKPIFKPSGHALTDIVNKIKEYIYDGQPEFVEKFLELLELSKFKVEERINILISLLVAAVNAEASSVMLAIILDRWGNTEDVGDYEGVLSDIAAIIYFPPKSLSYILKTMKELSIEAILEEAIKADTSVTAPPAFSIIGDRVIVGCGRKLKMEELERLLAAAVNHRRDDAIVYLQSLIREEETAVAPKPTWCHYDPKLHTSANLKACLDFYSTAEGFNTEKDYKLFLEYVYKYVSFDMDKPILYADQKAHHRRGDPKASLEDQVAAAVNPPPTEPTTDLVDETVVADSDDTQEDSEPKEFTEDIITPKMLLHDFFTMSTTEHRRKLFHQLQCRVGLDPTITCPHDHFPERKLLNPDCIYGLTNSIIDHECPTSLPGGCRMLTCCCRHHDDDVETDEGVRNHHNSDRANDIAQSWFTGFCDTCSVKIGHYSHCVRFPVTDGGWIGTYCSLKCIYELPPRPLYRIDTYRLQLIREQCQKVGMVDMSQVTL